jgi:hypothetical protein
LADLAVIRIEAGVSTRRACQLIDMPERTWRRWHATTPPRDVGHPTVQDCPVDVTTGRLLPVVTIVTDLKMSGGPFRSLRFEGFIAQRPELAHLRNRVGTPGQNGSRERGFGTPQVRAAVLDAINDAEMLAKHAEEATLTLGVAGSLRGCQARRCQMLKRWTLCLVLGHKWVPVPYPPDKLGASDARYARCTRCSHENHSGSSVRPTGAGT